MQFRSIIIPVNELVSHTWTASQCSENVQDRYNRNQGYFTCESGVVQNASNWHICEPGISDSFNGKLLAVTELLVCNGVLRSTENVKHQDQELKKAEKQKHKGQEFDNVRLRHRLGSFLHTSLTSLDSNKISVVEWPCCAFGRSGVLSVGISDILLHYVSEKKILTKECEHKNPIVAYPELICIIKIIPCHKVIILSWKIVS